MVSLETLPTYTPGSPEWAEQRRHRIGGSEIAAVLGLSPWESAFSLWHRKAGAYQPTDIDNDSMEWGRRLEDAVAVKFADNHPEYAVGQTGTYARGISLATPDRLLYAPALDALLEVKTARYGDDWGKAGTEDVPIYYRTQVLWYLDVLKLRTAHLAVLIAGCDYREYTIPYDAAEAGTMRDAAEQFMATITARTPPPLDGHDATYSTVRALHPDIDTTDVDVPPSIALRYCHAKQTVAAAKDAEKHATSILAQHMGSARRALHDGTVIATRQARNDGTPYIVAARNLNAITADQEAAA